MPNVENMFGNKPPPAKPGAKQQRPAPDAQPKQRQEKKKVPAPPPQPKPGQKKRNRPKEKEFFAKLLTSFITSGAAATLSAAAVALMIIYMQGQRMIDAQDRTPLIFGTFVTIFFVVLLLSLNQQFSLLGVALESDEKSRPRPATLMPGQQARMAARPATQEAEFDHVEIERGQEELAAQPAEDSDGAEELPPDLDADMGAQTQEAASPDPEGAQTQEAASPDPEPAPAEQQQAQTDQPEQTAPKPEPKVAAPEPKPEKKATEKSPGEAESRQIFAGFVAEANGTVQQELGELNAFSRFGMSLVLAGAISSLGQAKKLEREPQISMLKQGLKAIGNTPDRTDTFCTELSGYGKNPRYTGMIQSGSKAMSAYMSGNSGATAGMGSMLAEWSKPEKRTSVPSVFTFMFTDIVGSTAMTQAIGNANAQKVVRAHNTAVRNAIAKHKGREVKHTGDGIMGVFFDSPSAVNACVEMQRDIASHNARNPDLPLVVRIGLNAGEAVEEENDFFGAAVQMSARVCSKAANGHLWVSQSVVDACKGQRLGFIPRGKFEMKGIQGARTLYEVAWTEAHKNELADL